MYNAGGRILRERGEIVFNIIVNCHARRVKKLIAAMEARLRAHGAQYRFFYTQREGDAGKYAYSLSAAGGTEFIVVGGDGTLNEVVSGLFDPSVCTVGLVPAGTGNDFAASMNIPHGIRALDLILNGTPQPVDYIECGTRRSINIVGTGIDVEILRRCARMRVGTNKGKYFRSLVATLFHYRGTKLTVTVGGETKEYFALIAAVCNGKQFGGGIPICPVADAADGQLELVIVDSPKRRKIVFELIRLMRGKLLERPITHHISCSEALITSPDGNLFVQYDGEIEEAEALNAHLVAGKLRMYRG